MPVDGSVDPYLPDGDYDPDIDSYSAEQQVYYDNQAAAQYDDGYDPEAYTQFQSELDPYGSWIDDPTYGHVWVPAQSEVGYDFSPYSTGGNWTLSDYGWTWLSDWSWGWAPFHYGRWMSLSGRGWCWLPGRVWGPGWVSWRAGGGYVGWAPLPPRGVTIGPPPPRGGVMSAWRFTTAVNLGRRGPGYLPAHVVPSVFTRTAVINNARTVNLGNATVHVNAGPTGIAAPGSGAGLSMPVQLRTTAPSAMPHPQIQARAGVSLAERPWHGAQATQIPSRSIMVTARPSAPSVRAPSSMIAQPYTMHSAQVPQRQLPTYQTPASNPYPQPMYQQRAYNPYPQPRAFSPPPQRTYAPYQPRAYAPSQPVYRQPSYQAPSQPAYRAPAYQAPQYHSAPSYSAPSRPSAPSGGFSRPSSPSPSFHSGGGGGRHR